MKGPEIDLESERKEILRRYRDLLRACRCTMQPGDNKIIRQALNMSLESHQNMRRKSGEPYVYHPIAVAHIAAEEIGLGTTSIVCALLHDVVEDTDVTLDKIEQKFGKKVTQIIDGLTKLSGAFDAHCSLQAESFRKMLLTFADDVRVILIKLADRLHNMRTLEFMPRDKQLKLSSETTYLYAPLAHRLGLYAIKSELEDLSMKCMESETYQFIKNKLNEKKAERELFIQNFIKPIKVMLEQQQIRAEIFGRPKSIHSIWNKMRKKGIPFEEVYDLFAIRIVLESKPELEKASCWKVYSIVTDLYRPNPDRLHDWIAFPKVNGYESLHTTVMGPKGQWVEVQIRTARMNEIAERGFAAHWKYKESISDSGLDQWINTVRNLLSNMDTNALEFLDDFKMNLFSDEIFVFTPKGDLLQLPVGATALDLAFEVHPDVGAHCIGAKVNHKLVPINYKLRNGDQVEIITSRKQTPKDDWLHFVVTAKGKSKIKSALKEKRRQIIESGKEILARTMHSLKVTYNQENVQKISRCFKLSTTQDLLYHIGTGIINTKMLTEFNTTCSQHSMQSSYLQSIIHDVKEEDSAILLLGDNLEYIDHKLASCCNPIPGDDVFGFITINEGVKIHRTNCPNTAKLVSSRAYRVVKAQWASKRTLYFIAGLRIIGIDSVGMANRITTVISNDFMLNIRSVTVDSEHGIFKGLFTIYIHNKNHLDSLIKRMKTIRGVISIIRLDTEMDR